MYIDLLTQEDGWGLISSWAYHAGQGCGSGTSQRGKCDGTKNFCRPNCYILTTIELAASSNAVCILIAQNDIQCLLLFRQVIPPYNGFGSLEDTLQSCLSLIPQPPKKDFIRMLENDNKVLRYSAVLVCVCFSFFDCHVNMDYI